jgi:hypothetical protein
MFRQRIGISFLGFVSTAGLALSQETPTGIVKTGSLALLREEAKIVVGNDSSVESTLDGAGGVFVATDYSHSTPSAPPQITTIGPCSIAQLPAPITTPAGTVMTTLDAGPVLNLNGPNGMKQLPRNGSSYFALGGGVGLPISAPLFLDPGTYTIDNGGGGADVGPFSVTLSVPSPGFQWTNADADTSVDRSAGVDIEFAGGDPNTNVFIAGYSSITDAAGRIIGGATFGCMVPNNGDFVVTADVLSLLPATPTGARVGSSMLIISNTTQVTFTASGIDSGAFAYTASGSRDVTYK